MPPDSSGAPSSGAKPFKRPKGVGLSNVLVLVAFTAFGIGMFSLGRTSSSSRQALEDQSPASTTGFLPPRFKSATTSAAASAVGATSQEAATRARVSSAIKGAVEEATRSAISAAVQAAVEVATREQVDAAVEAAVHAVRHPSENNADGDHEAKVQTEKLQPTDRGGGAQWSALGYFTALFSRRPSGTSFMRPAAVVVEGSEGSPADAAEVRVQVPLDSANVTAVLPREDVMAESSTAAARRNLALAAELDSSPRKAAESVASTSTSSSHTSTTTPLQPAFQGKQKLLHHHPKLPLSYDLSKPTIDLKLRQLDVNDIRQLTSDLASNSVVTKLDLSYNHIGSEGAQLVARMLASNRRLKTLIMVKCGLGGEGLRYLGNALVENTVLERLELAENEIGSGGVGSFAKQLSQNKHLRNLGLASNGLGDRGFGVLSMSLSSADSGLEHLDLSSNSITGSGIDKKGSFGVRQKGTELERFLADNVRLKRLALDGNDIGQVGALSLAAGLRKNSVLKDLNLAWNPLGDLGGRAVAEALSANDALKALNLMHTSVSEQTAEALAKSLAENKSLVTLDLSINELGDIGVGKIGSQLEFFSGLREFSLGSTGASDGAGMLLAQGIRNSKLDILDLSGNHFGDDGVQAILTAVEGGDGKSGLRLDLRHNEPPVEIGIVLKLNAPSREALHETREWGREWGAGGR